MDAQKVDMYLMANAKCFEGHQISSVRDKLLALDDSKFIVLQATGLKDPTTILIVSLLAGTLGIDRFMVGLSSTIPDEKIRYKVIVEECLYFSDINKTNIFIFPNFI